MKVSEVMTHGVECISPDTTLQQAAKRMKDLNVGPLPVCGDNDRLVGMITDRDIVIRAVAEGWDPKRKRVEDALTPEVVYCFDDDDIDEAARLMRDNRIRRILVLNSDRRLVGIVSLGDLAVETGDESLAGRTLEEVSEPAMPSR
jgi:CBS domain-containing protein